jgi:hypothetical protein
MVMQWWPEGYTHHIKGHACYDASKVNPSLLYPLHVLSRMRHLAQQLHDIIRVQGSVHHSSLSHACQIESCVHELSMSLALLHASGPSIEQAAMASSMAGMCGMITGAQGLFVTLFC